MTGLKIQEGVLVKTNEALDAEGREQIVMLSQKEFESCALYKNHTASGHRYSIFEINPGYVFISLAVPDKSNINAFTSVSLYIIKSNIIFVDNKEYVANIIDRITKGYNSEMTIGKFLCCFLSQLIDKDMEFIERLEKQLYNSEEMALSSNIDNFSKIIDPPKKRLMVLYRYYNHLIDIGEDLYAVKGLFEKEQDAQLLNLFVNKAERLKSEISYLRDYVLQIQEIYQTQIGARQNDIMKMLTIVTTVVLPLSLIAGWYGMNFRYMPELAWKYGYVAVIILSIAIVVISVIVFKKKKYF